MKPEMIYHRISSISGDVERLSGVLCSMNSTSIQDAPDAYESCPLTRPNGRSGSHYAFGI